jgi:hypothetical protein
MGIEPHFNLWNYFFHVWLQLDSDSEAVVWGYTDIYVRTRPGIDPYFHLLVSIPLVGWWKEWFFLRNIVSVRLQRLWVGALPPNPVGGTGWLRNTPVSNDPCVTSSCVCSEMG